MQAPGAVLHAALWTLEQFFDAMRGMRLLYSITFDVNVSWRGCRMFEGHYLHASVCGFVSITLHEIQQVAWLGNAVLWLAEHLYKECRFGR